MLYVFLFLAAVLMVAAVLRPPVALAAMLCMYGFKQFGQATSTWVATHRTVPNFLMTGVLLIGIVGTLVRRRGALLRDYPTVGWLAVALFAWAALSTVWTHDPASAADAWRAQAPYVLTLVLLTPLLVTSVNDLRTGLIATAMFGAVILALVLVTGEWQDRKLVFSIAVQAGAEHVDMGNPLAISSLAAYVTLIGLLLNFGAGGIGWRVIRVVLIAIGLVALTRSGSRGQMIGAVLAAVAMYPISRRVHNVRAFVAGAAGLAVFLVLASWIFVKVADARRWDVETMSVQFRRGRIDTCVDLLTYWLNRSPPYWVIGLGNTSSYSPSIIGFYPHVVPVEVLAEEGVIGFVLLATIVAICAYDVLRTRVLIADSPPYRGALAVAAALVMLELLLSLKQGSLLGSSYLFTFAIILGRLARILRRDATEAWALHERQLALLDRPPESADAA